MLTSTKPLIRAVYIQKYLSVWKFENGDRENGNEDSICAERLSKEEKAYKKIIINISLPLEMDEGDGIEKCAGCRNHC